MCGDLFGNKLLLRCILQFHPAGAGVEEFLLQSGGVNFLTDVGGIVKPFSRGTDSLMGIVDGSETLAAALSTERHGRIV